MKMAISWGFPPFPPCLGFPIMLPCLPMGEVGYGPDRCAGKAKASFRPKMRRSKNDIATELHTTASRDTHSDAGPPSRTCTPCNTVHLRGLLYKTFQQVATSSRGGSSPKHCEEQRTIESTQNGDRDRTSRGG